MANWSREGVAAEPEAIVFGAGAGLIITLITESGTFPALSALMPSTLVSRPRKSAPAAPIARILVMMTFLGKTGLYHADYVLIGEPAPYTGLLWPNTVQAKRTITTIPESLVLFISFLASFLPSSITCSDV